MWTGFGINWVWIVGLVVMLGNRRGISYILYNLGKVAGTCVESELYLCCILYTWICMQMVIYPPYTDCICCILYIYVDLYANGYIPALYSLLGFSVWLHRLVDCYSISDATSIFPEWCNLICTFISVHIYWSENKYCRKTWGFRLKCINLVIVWLQCNRCCPEMVSVCKVGQTSRLQCNMLEKLSCCCCLKWFCLSSIQTVC